MFFTAIKLASVTQEEITAKRKAVDGLKDRYCEFHIYEPT
jgi:hypothetical protein